MTKSLAVQNPHGAHRLSLISLVANLWCQRQLIYQLIKREVLGRYKGSAMGLAWSFFHPVLMLAVYTFVFSEIFNARWGSTDGDQNKSQFAVILFAGLIVLNIFSESLNRAPTVIVGNVNYVKKVLFPIEILPVVVVGSSLLHGFISLLVLIAAFTFFNGYLNWTVVFLPMVIFPLVILTTAFAWFLASLGVYLRDVNQTIGLFTTVLIFLSPVLYPVTAVPEKFRIFIMANPLTFIIEQTREVVIWGRPPDWMGLSIYMIVSTAAAWLGFVWFQKTRRGFADVL